MKLSIIIPVFSGGNILKILYKRINDVLLNKFEFEVLFICDDCDLKSLTIVKELKKNDPDGIQVFQLARNYGQHRALQFGFGKTAGDFIITMDEDLQHDPSDILMLVEKQKEGNYDIVYGKFNNLQHKGVRNRISSILRKILKRFIPNLYDNYSPYRLIKHAIAVRTSTMVCPYTFIDDFLSRVTQNIGFADIRHYKRMEGESSYTFLKLIKHSIYILLAYSKIVAWLTAIAIISIFTGASLFIVNIITKDNNRPEIFENRTIAMTLGIGLLLIIVSFFGTSVNHRNTIRNTRPVSIINKDSI